MKSRHKMKFMTLMIIDLKNTIDYHDHISREMTILQHLSICDTDFVMFAIAVSLATAV